MTDRIALTGLRVRGFHGVFDHERRDGQDFVVDAVLELDTAPAAASDDLARHRRTTARWPQGWPPSSAGEPVNLLETLAERLADGLPAPTRGSRRRRSTVHKPQAPIPLAFADVAVTIRRDRPDSAP